MTMLMIVGDTASDVEHAPWESTVSNVSGTEGGADVDEQVYTRAGL